ncbi:AhpC/TSA family protein [Chitinophaga sedimenti]|uniref:AhpC/TSA family protein n=1 Tax=Chitinophaga sedimenti TaxID=2033606 RepID=UPI002004C42D|nr:AhpC/TSA family protein [Chitinophaga sedimenti]MCK7558955.1 AhpC/TSA family protein [Chitinophaga sedimenti]
MKKSIILSAVAATIMVAGCNQQEEKGEFRIDVKLDHAPLHSVVLEEIALDGPKIVDSTKITDPAGKFTLKGLVNSRGLYRIQFEDGKFLLLALDAGDMAIDGDYNQLEKVAIKGSDGTVEIRDLLNHYNEKAISLTSLRMRLDSLQALKGTDSLVGVVNEQFEKGVMEMKKNVDDVVNGTKNPATAIFALSLVPAETAEERAAYQAQLASVRKRFPENAFVLAVAQRVDEDMKAKPRQPAADGPAAMIGQTAPDFTLPDVNGKMVSLSAMRGKYVLVDFWASWCGPCRQENPNVVAAFNTYKAKNFTILGVSLDEDKGKWQQAIANDKLAWAHVSDLRQWESAVVPLYNITGIPTNILLDPSGKIIAANLRGPQLEAKLAEVLK